MYPGGLASSYRVRRTATYNASQQCLFCAYQVRQLQKVEETGEWRAYVLGLEPIGDVSGFCVCTYIHMYMCN